MAFFERIDATRFAATEHVSGAWAIDEQHVAPVLGLLAHVVETDRDSRRDDGPVIGRLSYDILGTLPVEEVSTRVRVLRAGRTIELVEARAAHGGRDAVALRAWLMAERDTATLRGTAFPSIPGPEEMARIDPGQRWPGGFISSVDVRRCRLEPGRAAFWVRSQQPLLEGEPVGPLAHFTRLLDIANGMAVRADPHLVHFPNLDLTAHFFAQPAGEWVGFDTTVSFGSAGIGLTSSVLHDSAGPVGTLNQILTIRPRGSSATRPPSS